MSTKLLSVGDGQMEKKSHHTERAVITQEMIDDFPVNYKGLYTLKYKKKKEQKGSTIEDIEKKFADYGKVTEVDGDDWWIYVRFSVKDHAVAVLKAFGEELSLKIVYDRHHYKDGQHQRLVEVYIGNLPPIVKEGKNINARYTWRFVFPWRLGN
ncbi:uncharacterized protein LOC132550636 [Ylistrum balloti]|uniref:uncharacterized protein LOC132550636 n=1 Tax=Ylistrum balloti TaxID=509963 RepID=UPI002905C9FF|nr:uncharacterized protein LOC132550636 [Ylistrum balloti]